MANNSKETVIHYMQQVGTGRNKAEEIIEKGDKSLIIHYLKLAGVNINTAENLVNSLQWPIKTLPPQLLEDSTVALSKPPDKTVVPCSTEVKRVKIYKDLTTINSVNFIVICFYTPEYSEIVKLLFTSLQWLKLPYHIECIPKTDTWQNMTWYKPEFIEKMHQLYPTKNLFWTDADSCFLRYPQELININGDVSICYTEGVHRIHKNISIDQMVDKRLYHSGSFMVKPSGIEVIKNWVLLKKEFMTKVPDQYVINFAIHNSNNTQVSRLSFDYLNTLHDNLTRCGGLITSTHPAIMHFIYSNITDETVNQKSYISFMSQITNNGETNAERLLQYKQTISTNLNHRAIDINATFDTKKV